jgi:hypothetical protein
MKLSELKKQIEEAITEILSEAGEKTAMVTTQSGETTAVDYKSPDELNKIKDNSDIKSIKTGAGQKIKEAEDDEFDAPEKEPSKSELKKIDKEFSSSKFAKKLSPEEKERLDKIESGIKKKLANPTKENIAVVRQLINRADVKKLFKDGGKDLKALISDIIK